MTHIRQTIRDQFVTALTGLTTTGSRVYASRTMPMSDDTIPGLNVYTGAEEIDLEEGSRFARVQERSLEIVVEGYDKLTAGLDDQLDTIAAEVETAILAVGAIAAASNIDLSGIDEPEIYGGLEVPVGRIRIRFRVRYLTADGAPTTAL